MTYIFFTFSVQDHDGHMQIHTKHSISSSRQRPYHVENTASRPISEGKQRWVWSVLGWVTAWEHQMLLAFLPLLLGTTNGDVQT